MPTHPLSPMPLRRVPSQYRGVEQRLVRAPWMDHRRHEAWARARFWITVADAQGVRCDAERSRCQRWSMTRDGLHQARQALIQRGVVASQHPRSPV
jgi:hypothetical protein